MIICTAMFMEVCVILYNRQKVLVKRSNAYGSVCCILVPYQGIFTKVPNQELFTQRRLCLATERNKNLAVPVPYLLSTQQCLWKRVLYYGTISGIILYELGIIYRVTKVPN